MKFWLKILKKYFAETRYIYINTFRIPADNYYLTPIVEKSIIEMESGKTFPADNWHDNLVYL